MKSPVRRNRTVWSVVFVERGFIEKVRLFQTRELADRLCRRWKKKVNPDYDEVAIVRSRLPA